MFLLCHPWFTTSNLSYFLFLKLPLPPCAVLLVKKSGTFMRRQQICRKKPKFVQSTFVRTQFFESSREDTEAPSSMFERAFLWKLFIKICARFGLENAKNPARKQGCVFLNIARWRRRLFLNIERPLFSSTFLELAFLSVLTSNELLSCVQGGGYVSSNLFQREVPPYSNRVLVLIHPLSWKSPHTWLNDKNQGGCHKGKKTFFGRVENVASRKK